MKSIYPQIKKVSLLLFTIISIGLSSQTSAPPMVRLIMNTTQFNDETVFYFQQGGTTGFQSAFDAYKLVFNAGTHPYIGSISDSILTSISGLPELPVNLSIPVKAISPASGSFTFSTEKSDFPNNVCVTLHDAFTGATTNILTSEYVCTLYDTTSIARFTMNFYTTTVNATSFVKQPDCLSPNGGIITVKGDNAGPWNYEWKNGDSIIKTSLNKNAPDSLTDLNGGNYSVKITGTGSCGYFSKTFVVESIVAPTASFVPDVFTTSLSNSGRVNFTNKSTGSQINSWDFGDNSGTWYVPSPSYNYHSAGIYTVTLISESISHCKSKTQQVVNVINDVTGIATLNLNENLRLATLSRGNYELVMSFEYATTLEVNVFDLNGNLLNKTELPQITQTKYSINLENFSSGMYLVKVISEKSAEKTFKLIN